MMDDDVVSCISRLHFLSVRPHSDLNVFSPKKEHVHGQQHLHIRAVLPVHIDSAEGRVGGRQQRLRAKTP